jgi:hypothetical protein
MYLTFGETVVFYPGLAMACRLAPHLVGATIINVAFMDIVTLYIPRMSEEFPYRHMFLRYWVHRLFRMKSIMVPNPFDTYRVPSTYMIVAYRQKQKEF